MIMSTYQNHLKGEFSVIYEGDALNNNTMDVKDLAPALLSLGQAFDRANSLLNGDKSEVNLQIKALSPGSFDISLVLTQMLHGASGVMSWDLLTNANALIVLIIGTPVSVLGLVHLIKELKGKKPKQTESPDGIIFEADNIKLTISKDVARLYNDKPMRDQIEGVVRPLLKSGISKVTFKHNEKLIGGINGPEAGYFSSLDDKDNVTEIIIPKQRLQIDSLRFKQGKWQLSDGAHTNYYTMDDKDFLQAIENGKTFGKYHILICEVLMTQHQQMDGKLKLDYAVKKVLKHITPAEQFQLREQQE